MDTTTTAKPAYKKVATIAAVIGMLLIAAAGWLTARDHFARADTACALAPKVGPVAPEDELQVLDVASPGAPNEAVVALGKPLCVTIANVRTASDVQAVNADVVTAKADHESVIARIASGTDRYAPFALPPKFLVHPPGPNAENLPLADSDADSPKSQKARKHVVRPAFARHNRCRRRGMMRTCGLEPQAEASTDVFPSAFASFVSVAGRGNSADLFVPKRM